jgi:hypothetical protein
MTSLKITIESILANVPEERKEAFTKLHQTIVSNLPEGFEPGISYNKSTHAENDS